MTGSLWDDSEYPYHAQYGARQAQVAAQPMRWRFPWQAFLRWTKRLAVAAAGVVVVTLVLGAIFGHRIITDAILVAQLQAHGCNVTFVHQLSGEPDPLHPLVRKVVGDEVFSDVAELSYVESGFRWNGDQGDVEIICQSCRRLTKLRSLAIDSDSFAWEQIKDLPNLKQLESLELGSSSLTDEDLPRIAGISGLKKLKLRSPQVTIAAAAALAKLRSLESLELHAVKGAPGNAIAGQGFASLKRLVIEESELDDESLISLGPLPVLEAVELNQANLSDRGVAHLLSSPFVQSLILNDASELDIDSSALIRCPGPAIYHLARTSLADDGLAPLAGREITSLVLDGTQVTDAGLEAIGQLNDLRHLSLRDTKITGASAAHLAGLSYLTQLDLTGAALTTEGAAAIANLRIAEVVLANTPLTDEGLLHFADSDLLNRLDITGTQVTADGVKALYEARKRRLSAASRAEFLLLLTDHSDVVAEYIDTSVLSAAGGEFAFPDYGF